MLPGRSMAGRESLKLAISVRFAARQPKEGELFGERRPARTKSEPGSPASPVLAAQPLDSTRSGEGYGYFQKKPPYPPVPSSKTEILIAGSANGRPTGSDPVDVGSTPAPAATALSDKGSLRACHVRNRSSILRGAARITCRGDDPMGRALVSKTSSSRFESCHPCQSLS